MNHPLFSQSRNIIIYLILWIAIGFLYFLLLQNRLHFEMPEALTESILNTLFLGVLNIGIWYFVKYNLFEEKTHLQLIVNIFASFLIFLSVQIFTVSALCVLAAEKSLTFENIFTQSFLIKIYFGSGSVLLMTFIYYLHIYYQNFKKNAERKTELAKLLTEQELTNLKSQINPHFLFNSLNTISYLIYTQPEHAHESIVKLSDFFRYSLSRSQNNMIPLREELENSFRYLDIEKYRFNNKLNIVKDIDEQCLNYIVPTMILQPLFENSIKYGVYESLQPISLEITITDNNKFFTFFINNTFDSDAKQPKGTSTGLENVRKRLQLIYQRNDLLFVTKRMNTFEVKILFPKKIDS